MVKIRLVLGVLLLGIWVIAVAQTHQPGVPDQGAETTLSGKIACTHCTLKDPNHKPSKECCQGCIKSGDAPLFKAADNQLYTLVSGTHELKLMTPERMELVGEPVKVTGKVVKNGGLQGIYVTKIEKAAAEAAQAEPAKAQ